MINICPTLSQLPAPPPGKTGWPWTKLNSQPSLVQLDSSQLPTFSIVTPSYNQGRFIEKTIRSVLLQGYPNLEYNIIDGGSNDQSVTIIKKYEQWLNYWTSEPDRGQSHAINKGFKHASGDIYAWLNSDDIYLADTINSVAQQFRKYSNEVGALVGIGQKVNQKGDILYVPKVPELNYHAFLNWLEGYNFMQPSCFFRKKAWKTCGPLREDLTYPMDVDLWIKISKKFKFKKLNQILSHALIHELAKTTSEKERMRAETILLVMQHGGEKAAKQQIIKMADDLAEANRKLQQLRSFLPYKIFSPIYFWLQKKLSSG